jgi:hypothetical protein
MNSIPEKYRNDISIIRDTARQISRDFNIEGIEITFSGNDQLAFEEFKMQITPLISKIFNHDRIAFQALLYRIDINEKDYKKALSKIDSKEFESELAELIIRREFQKILTKRYFSTDKK